MARYQVTLGGRTIILEGDHPPSEAEVRAALAEMPRSDAKPIDPNEPDTYLGGAAKGALEGSEDALKGFAGGLIASPRDLVANVLGIPRMLGRVLTQSPEATAMQAIKPVIDAAQAAGTPEGAQAWGQGVGSLTGQTELGLLAGGIPKTVAAAKAGGAGLGDIAPPIISRNVPQVIPKIVQGFRNMRVPEGAGTADFSMRGSVPTSGTIPKMLGTTVLPDTPVSVPSPTSLAALEAEAPSVGTRRTLTPADFPQSMQPFIQPEEIAKPIYKGPTAHPYNPLTIQDMLAALALRAKGGIE